MHPASLNPSYVLLTICARVEHMATARSTHVCACFGCPRHDSCRRLAMSGFNSEKRPGLYKRLCDIIGLVWLATTPVDVALPTTGRRGSCVMEDGNPVFRSL